MIASSAFFIKKGKETEPPTHPNSLVILTDQWEGRALGYLGKENVKTPHLDAFAKESLTLAQMVSNYSHIMGNIPSNNVRINSGFRGIRTENYKLAYERRGKKLEGFLFSV